jgi:hypothetical protein
VVKEILVLCKAIAHRQTKDTVDYQADVDARDRVFEAEDKRRAARRQSEACYNSLEDSENSTKEESIFDNTDLATAESTDESEPEEPLPTPP